MVENSLFSTRVGDIVTSSLTVCAEKWFSGEIPDLIRAIRRSREDVCHSFSEEVGQQAAACLAELFPPVKAVFQYQLEPSGIRALEDEVSVEHGCAVNLVVWGDEFSSTEEDGLASFQQILSRQIGEKLYDMPPAGFPVSISLVDRQMIARQQGLGVMVGSDAIRTSRVWPSAESRNQVPITKQSALPRDKLLEELAGIDLKMAPEERILKHAQSIEAVPAEHRGALDYHLMELKVNLIRKMISDQLTYINIARKWFNTEDLADLYERRIGYGKIGGKAAGMMLASRILSEVGSDQVRSALQIPESYFLGSDLIYIFMSMNGLMHWNEQKYKPEEEIRSQYQQIQEEFLGGQFPPEIVHALQAILDELGTCPLIVRSSSQLEDNFGTAFAGKYDSYFCPNQGSPEQNLQDLLRAISQTYASTLKPEALLYRQRRGLQDYDERMAVLIQAVQGEQVEDYYLPHAAGVAFSRNMFRWSPQIRPEEGFTRLVWGLGTRAVNRGGGDYPRLVALSHPELHPDDQVQSIKKYSQREVDLIDLSENAFQTLPISEVLSARYRPLRYLAELDQGGYLTIPRMRVSQQQIPDLTLTFQGLIKQTPFVDLLREMLTTLEDHYHDAVDLEYTLQINTDRNADLPLKISLLQCRPQPHLQDVHAVALPPALAEQDVVFETSFMVPQGYLSDIRYVVFVDPEEYFALPTAEARAAVPRAISHLNELLPAKKFICVGPGRWGSENTDLGVFVSYADVHRSGALIELTGRMVGSDPDPSVGTHFFQDLMEAEIYPVVLDLDRKDSVWMESFFRDSPNHLQDWIPVENSLQKCLKVISVSKVRAESHLELVLDDRAPKAICFFESD